MDQAFQNKKKVKGLLKRHFKQLLTLVVKSSCFVLNDTYYQQIDGVAMGSPLEPTFANLFLVYYEHNRLKNCRLQFKSKFYRRYVDDIFLMFEKKEHVKKFFWYMNSRHRNNKFTFEEEQDNKILFLDISITRVWNELQTSLFRKKTFSGVYLNFNSHLPNMYKKGLIDTLLYWAYNICSSYASFDQEINYLKTVWQKNSFTLFFIDKCVQKFLNKLFIKRNHQKLTSAKKEVLITLEFLGKTSLQVKKQLKDIFRSCQKHVKLNVVFKSSIRIKNAFRFKDALPKHINSKVLYKFKCNTCNSVYIGKTKRHLLVRQYEHLGLSVLTNKALKYTEKDPTVIRKHCHQSEHYCTVDNFKIVGNATNDFYLKLKESLLILKMKPSLNIAQESIPLLPLMILKRY